MWQNFHKISGKRSQAETNNPVTIKDGTPKENDIEKANAFAETLGGIHNTHKGPIFDDNFQNEVDDKIAENYHFFNPLALYVDEKGDENPIMRHISISEIKKQPSKTKARSAPGQDYSIYGTKTMSRNSIRKPRTNLQYMPTNWFFSRALKSSNGNYDSKTK